MWFERTHEAAYLALCTVFGIDPSLSASRERFRPAYDPAVTVPGFSPDCDVCFYSLARQSEPGTEGVIRLKLPGGGSDTGREETHQLLSVILLLNFYGPAAAEDAEKCRSGMLDEQARRIFRERGVYPVKMPSAPISLPEPYGTLWRRRCDLKIRLYVAERTEKTYPALRGLPEVIIHDGRGVS